MKHLFVFLAILFITEVSYSQSLGASIGLVKADSYSKNGFGLTIEYDKSLSSDFELTLISSILINSEEHSIGKLEYLQIPITLGIRYYLLTTTIKPYVSLEGGISYFSNDQISTTFIDPNYPQGGTETNINSSNKIILGIGPSIGFKINVSKNLDININAKYYIGSDSYADFLTINCGIIFGI